MTAFDLSTHGAGGTGGNGGTSVLAPPDVRPIGRRTRKRERRAPPPTPPGDFDGDSGNNGGAGEGADGSGSESFGPTPVSAAPFALALAMVGITTLFAVFLGSWFLLRRHEPGATNAAELVPMSSLWFSTLLLFGSGATIECCVRSSFAARARRTHAWLARSVALGLSFLAAQAWLCVQLVDAGLVPSSGAYGAMFFVLIGLHAAHLMCGVGSMGVMLRRTRTGRVRPATLRLCASYWHFMGALWLVIFSALYFLR